MSDRGTDEQGNERAVAAQRSSTAQKRSMVRAVRLAAGLSQAELAARMGLTQGRIAALESQGEAVMLTTLGRVAKAAGVRLTWSIATDADHANKVIAG